MCFVVPNLVQAEEFFRDWSESHRKKVRGITRRFVEEGMISFIDERPYITPKGHMYLLKNIIKNFEVHFSEDTGFTLLVFDIPEQKKVVRDALRRKLYSLGFVKLQNSVLLRKGYCSDSIFEFFKLLGISECVYVIRTESIKGIKLLDI